MTCAANAEADLENDPTVAESAATVEEASPRRFGHYEIATHSDGVTMPFAKLLNLLPTTSALTGWQLSER
jgi:hypothetical protein